MFSKSAFCRPISEKRLILYAEGSPMIEKMLPELLMLSVVIIAMVAQFKQFGAVGNTLTALAFAFGLVLGMGYRYAVGPMLTFADWFWALLFSLLAGAIATGAYKAGQSITGNDTAGIAATLKADNKQTAKIIDAVTTDTKPS